MNNKQINRIHTAKFLRKRKMFLALPMLALPFVTMAFWALGGGESERAKRNSDSGLNLQLPNPHLKDDKSETKLSFYENADKDSFKLQQVRKADQFAKYEMDKDTSIVASKNDKSYLDDNALKGANYADPNEEKVYSKLAQLKMQMNVPAASPVYEQQRPEEIAIPEQEVQQDTPGEDDDLEMNQLNNMMEKVLDIQHPDRIKERLIDQCNNTTGVFQVIKVSGNSSVGLLDTSAKNINAANGFYGIGKEKSEEQNAIEAIVQKDQTLISGGLIKLRLLNDISVDNTIIPKDNFINGTVSVANERLLIEINSIRVGASLFPVKLKVYDMDGLEGIYIPGAINRDAAKDGLNNATQMMQISSLDPSMKAQAASAGIDAAKTLLSKKTRQVRVTVKAGYKVLLQ
jgi:conjugative transposon TraM protein